MGHTQSWEVSDAIWKMIEPLIANKKREAGRDYHRQQGAGRKPLAMRQVFPGIISLLRTGIHWKAVPKEQFGSPSAIHRYFLEWQAAGFKEKIHC